MAESQRINVDLEALDAQIAAVLHYRYGDGLVYLPKNRFMKLYLQAREIGYIDGEGYLTRKGRALLARFQYI